MNRLNPINPTLVAVLLGCTLMFFLTGPSTVPAEEQESVEADGTAVIQSSNLAQARELALSLALRSALEKVVASYTAPDAPAGRKAILNEKIYPSAERYIVRFRILREAEQDGAYAVKIAATVDAAGLKGDLRRYGVLAGKADEPRSAEHQFVLSVQGAFASHHDYLAFRDMISGIPGIQSVTPVSIAPDRSEWCLQSTEGAQAVARDLSKRRFKGTALRVVQSGADAIVVTLNSKGD